MASLLLGLVRMLDNRIDNDAVSGSERAGLARLVEVAAQAVVMLDSRDLPSLAQLTKVLREIGSTMAGQVAPGADLAGCGAAATKAAALLERIILEESDDSGRDIETVCGTISALQSIVCHSHFSAFPSELGIALVATSSDGALAPGCEEPGGEPDRPAHGEVNVKTESTPVSGIAVGRVVSHVQDDELFVAFIAQQQSVLPEIDEAILAFEKDAGPNHLAALRRVIHTMKGEAGVCGVTDIATVCHKVEDYLECGLRTADPQSAVAGAALHTGSEPAAKAISPDVLFAVKDWIEKAIEAYVRGEIPTGLADLLVRLESADENRHEPVGPLSVAVAEPVKQVGSVPIGDRELAADFIGEAQEHFDTADENLLRLESDPTNKDAIGAVFRAFHTIKGVSGFIGLTPIGELAHAAESLLDDVRKDRKEFRGAVADVTFRALDLLKQMLADLAKALQAGADLTVIPELPAMLATLKHVREGGGVPKGQDGSHRLQGAKESRLGVPDSSPGGGEQVPYAELLKSDDEMPASLLQPGAATGAPGATLIKATMKVDTEKIDNLLDTIGELVITESMVINSEEIKSLGSRVLDRDLSQLSKITRQLQNMSMAMRLIPVDGIFKKMARLVRDLSKKSGKQIDFTMEGQETEIDKSMVDKLGDPLVHMIRNSADHGIEPAEDRRASGKNPTGHITLKAFHRGGAIHIQIIDDGRGLDRDAIVAKAVEKGLISGGASMSDQEVFALIFEAGFSTAKTVTDISGRGVGMDVVRRNIESLRGKVLIESKPGKGSTFTLVLPLTTAIIDGMLIQVGAEIYTIPTLSIVQSFQPRAGQVSTVVGRGRMVDFRGRLLPLCSLAEAFDIQGANRQIEESVIVVVEYEGRHVALVVDRLLGQSQTVIKSMGDSLGHIPGISGASIMSDGKPGMILDVGGVVKLTSFL